VEFVGTIGLFASMIKGAMETSATTMPVERNNLKKENFEN